MAKKQDENQAQAQDFPFEEPDDSMLELVDFYAPKLPAGQEQEIFVALNGKAWLIKRGEHVKLPKPVKAILDQAAEAEQRELDYIDQIQGSGAPG